MTAKRKITDKNGVQVFPITHTKAVLDDNGNSVEQRLQEQMDLINQKQLEVGAVPSDVTPTVGSANWVTSGGVYDTISRKADKDDVFVTHDWDLSEDGDFTYILGTIHDDGNAYSSSSYYHVNIPVGEGLGIKIKANNSESARYAFLKDINFTYTPSGGTDITEHYAVNHIGINIITSGREESFTIPEGCNYLYVEIGKKTGVVRTPAEVAYYEPQWDVLFRELSSEMLAEEDIDLTIYGRKNAYPQTNWVKTIQSVFVPVNYGENYAIKTSSNALTVSMLSSDNYTIGENPTTVIEKVTLPANAESKVTVPEGTEYMLIALKKLNNDTIYEPEYVKKIYRCTDLTEANTNKIKELDIDCTNWQEVGDSDAISGVLNISGVWVLSSGSNSGEVVVRSGEKILVTAKNNEPAALFWLTASDTSHSNGDAAPVLSSRGQILIPAGEQRLLYVPEGASVLNYQRTYSYTDRAPSIKKDMGNEVDGEVSEKIIVPKIGCGTSIVSRLEDTYAHAPIILESTKYRYVIYQGSENVTIEDGHGTTYSHVLSVLNKYTGKTQFIKVFDCNNPDVINGNTCSIYYNESAAFVGEDILLIRTGCHLDGKWVEVYKTYNAVTNTLSSAALQQLSYGGSTYDFNLHNYLTMCNTLYGTSLNVVDVRYTNQITNITKYGNYYYCVYALLPDSDVELPYVFARSSDAITWVPIANVYTGHSAETQLAIVNDVAYFAFRAMNLGTFFMAFNISDGSVVQSAYKMSNMASKPSIVYSAKHGKVIVGYNKVVGSASNRIGLTVAEVNADYTLTTLKNYINSNGWNYFYFCAKPNGNIMSVCVEDFRQLNGGVLNAQTTTDVRIEEIDMFELLNQ